MRPPEAARHFARDRRRDGYFEAATTGTPEVRITVDKSAAMRYNLTTAQIYADLAQAVANETTSTTLTVGADSIPVVVLRGGAGRVTRDNLMNYTFDATNAEGETQTVRLGDIAALSEADSVPSIRREKRSAHNECHCRRRRRAQYRPCKPRRAAEAGRLYAAGRLHHHAGGRE